jgi:hypothetical protein
MITLSGDIEMLVRGRRPMAVIGLALLIPFAAFEYRVHHIYPKAMNRPNAGMLATTVAPPSSKMDRTVEENVSLGDWQRSIESALPKAEAKEPIAQELKTKSEGSHVTERSPALGVNQEKAPPIDLGTIRESANQQTIAVRLGNESNQTGETTTTGEANETGPTTVNRVVEARDTDTQSGADAAKPTARPATPHAPRIRGQSAYRGRRRGSPYEWPFYQLAGVVRALPNIWNFVP